MAREAVVSVRNADDDIVYTVDVEGSDEPVNILRGASLVYDPQTGAVDVPATLRRAQEQGLPETVAIRYADGKPGIVHISELQTVLEAADSEEVVREARTAAEQQVAAMQQDAAEAEPAGSVPEETEPTAAAADPLVGRLLTDEEAGQVIGQMEAAAEPAPELELTPENWMAQFGEEGKVQTPIGEVKMGENQYLKLLKTGREKYFGMIKPTLDTPDVVLEESDPQDGAERNSKYLFIKTFIKPDGSRYIHFESVTVRKDNLEVSVSSHEIDKGPFQKKMQNDRVLHLKKSLFDSEGRLTEPRMEGPDLVPTPRTSNSKDTTTIPENQTAKAEIPRQKNGQPDFNAMPADMLAVELLAAVGHDKAVKRLQVARGVNAKSMDKLRKSLDGMGDLNKAMAVEQRLAAMQQEDARLSEALEQLGDMAARHAEDDAAPRDAEDLAAVEAYDQERNNSRPEPVIAERPGPDDVPFSVVGGASAAPAGVTPERWKVIVDQLRRVIGAENVVTDPAAVLAAYDRIMGRGMEIRRRQVAEANERYNTQLDLFTEGKLPSGDKIDLGYPGATLLACGIRNADMMIAQRVLKDHMEKHGLTADDIRNLPAALENPIMVYEWGDKAKTTIVITEIPRETERIAVALRFRQTVDGIKINKVVSVHGKSIDRLLTDMNTPLTDFGAENLKWVDKEKASDWLITGGSFGPSASDQRLVTAVKIVTNFDNPKIGPENIVPQDKKTRYFRTPEGEVYGFTAGGKIYLDSERMNAATPMHEYTELWSQIVARENPAWWNRAKEIMRGDTGRLGEIWQEVNADPNYRDLGEDLRASETLSRATGEWFARKQAGIRDHENLFAVLKRLVREFWRKLKSAFAKWSDKELARMKADDVMGAPLKDFVEGIDLTKYRDEKTLAGVHNISAEKLKKAIKQGGLANPSAAVIDVEKQSHEGYGEISLILPSSLVDKRAGRNAGTWTADAWTPTYPDVERQFSDDGGERFARDMQALPKAMYAETRMGMNDWLDGRGSRQLAYMFLHERGEAPELQIIPARYGDATRKAVENATQGAFDLYNAGPEERQAVLEAYIGEKFGGDRAAYEQALAGTVARMEGLLNHERAMVRRRAAETLAGIRETGFDYNELSDFARSVGDDVRRGGKADAAATNEAAVKQIEDNGLQGEFDKWVDGFEERYGVREVLFDGFTPSGTRRYLPNTLENASKMMKTAGRNGATGMGISFSNFAAGLLDSLGSLKDIRARKGSLTTNHEEVDAFRDRWSQVFFDLGEKCQPDAEGYDDYGLYRLAEAARKRDPQAYLKKEYGVELSDEDTARLKEMVKAIRTEFPAMYFETKFERPVYLNEMAGAVVPENTDKDILDALDAAGIPYRTYGAAEERPQVIRKFSEELEGVRFSTNGEKARIREQARRDGTYLKAPNGQPSKLTADQWETVRTRQFKEWFGDWENEPENASKIVDENGEPMVVYHGTPLSRNQITPNRGWHGDDYVSQEAPFHTFRGGEYSGLIFTSVDYDQARIIASRRSMEIPDDERGNEQWTEEGYVYDLYANVKKPFDPQDRNAMSEVLHQFGDKIPTLSFYGGKGDSVSPDVALKMAASESNSWMLTETPEFLSKVKELGYDGLVGYDEWVKYIAVVSPDQIKSATENIGAFDPANPDIRFNREFTERRVTTLEKLENKRDALIADRGNIANFDEQIAAVEAEIEAYMQSDPVADTFGKDGAGDAHLQAVEDTVYDMQREINLPTQTVVVRNADEFIARLREMGATDEQLKGISLEHCPEGAQWRGEIVIRGDAVADKVHAQVIYIHEQAHDITEALFTPDELYDAAEEMGADYMNKRLEERNASYHVDGNSVESMIHGANEMISRGVDLLYRKGLLTEFFATENGPIYPVIMYMEEHGVPSRLKDLIVENLQNIKADQYGTERTRQNIPGEVERQLDSRLFPAREGDGTADETGGRTGTAGDAVPERIGAGAAGVAADAGGRIGGRGRDLERPSFSFGDSRNDAPKLTKQQQLIADVEAAVSDPRNDIATTIRNFMPQVETLREALVEELEGDPAGELLSAFGSAGDRATAIGALREMRQALLDRDIRRKEEDARRRAERREYHEKVLNLYSRLTETDVEPDKLPQSVTSYIKTLVTPELMEVMGIRDFHSIATDIETALQQDKIQNTFAEYRKQRAHYRDIQQTETDPAVLESERQVMESAARTFADRVLASRPMQRIMDAVADMDLRLAKNRFDDLLRLKVEGLNASGVNTAKSVDENTRVFFKLLRDNLGLTEAQLQAKIDKLQDGNAVNPLVNFDGVMLHAMYRACLEEENNIDDLKSRLRKYSRESVRLYHVITGKSKGVSDALREEARANRATARRAIDATRAALVAAKSHLAGNYANLNQHLTSKLETGKTLFSDVEEARKRHQKHLVSEAVKAVKPDPGSKTQNADFPEGSRFVKGITSPFASFESMLQTVSINDPGRNGFLTQHFMLGPDGWAEANGQYQQRRSEILNGILAAFDRLVLHKKSDTSDRSLGKRLVERLERPFKETDTDDLFRYFGERLSDRDGNPVILETTSPEGSYYKSRSIVVTRGKALLWIAWGRQSELMPRLENIGLDREKLEILRSLLSKEDLAFLDWIQLELLPELLKERYNPVYRRMFGVDMDSTAWYFPFVANKNMVRQEVDMSQIESDGLPATITGSIIRRRHTMIEPDLDVDLMGVLTNHIGEMEHWAAFAPFISDINTLLSSPTFRNALESQQKGRYSAFKKVCFIAADAYRKFQPDPSEQFLTTLEKTCASAKIAWRGFTALKQVLSGVMFRTYTSDARFQKIVTRHLWDPFVTWKDWTWCMENLPSFRERWESRYAGDERLALKSPSRGRLNQAIFDHRGIQKTRRWFLRSFMYMNALVDAWVCARGARAVYLFEMERLQERGLDAGEADRQAKILAAIAMNTTQQSSEGAYMSVLQSDRTYMSATLSIFNNSSFAFGRIAQQAFKVLTMSKARREEVLEARKRYWIGRGLDETQATTRAREDMRRLMRDARLKLLLAGYLGNLIWNLFPPVMTAFVGGFNRDRDNRDSSYWRTWWNTLRNEVSWSTFVTPVFRNFAGGSQAEGVVNGFDLSLSMALQDYEKLKKEVSDVISDFSPALALHLLGKVGALGLGVDFDTFVNMYKGAHKMFTRHETAAGIFQFLNSPKAILAAAEHSPGRGETDREYMERMAYAEGIAEEEMKRMETAPSYRLDDSNRKVLHKMKKWERNYLAYRQASALGMSWERDKFGNVTIPELKRLDEDYESAVKWMGLTRSGEPVDELKKNWDSLGRQEEELTIDIIGRVHAIYPFERELENNVVFGDEYREQMKALVKLKQEVVALVENNK